MSRSAALVLGKSVEGGQRMGECLQAAGYDVDREAIERRVKRGEDITLPSTGRPSPVYRVRVSGREDLSFAVVYGSGSVHAGSDHDQQALAEIGCSIT